MITYDKFRYTNIIGTVFDFFSFLFPCHGSSKVVLEALA